MFSETNFHEILDCFWHNAAVTMRVSTVQPAFCYSPKGVHGYETQTQGRNRPVREDAARTRVRGGHGWKPLRAAEGRPDSGYADLSKQRRNEAGGHGRSQPGRRSRCGTPERDQRDRYALAD